MDTYGSKLKAGKDPFIEPRGSSAFNAIVRNFETQAKTDRGAVFFGVHRGKARKGSIFPIIALEASL